MAQQLRAELTRLKRHHLARVVVGYAVVAWLVLQIASVVLPGLNLPGWTMTLVIVLTGIGFPLALFLAWARDAGAGAPAQAQAAAPEGPSIAVLPFADMSQARDQDYFCDGIAEELLNALSGISGLRVAARSSSFQFKGRASDPREIAHTLGVSTLLEGSVRKAGDRLRITARLDDAQGYEVWSQTFDRALSDVFAIQTEIAEAVVRALRLRLSSREAGRLGAVGTRNTAAYELYLRGRESFRTWWDSRQWLSARQMFKGALELDPQFAQAWAALADVCFFTVQWHVATQIEEALREEAIAASAEALRLDPDLAEAHVARGNVLSLDRRDGEADDEFRRAIALHPALGDTYYWFGRHLAATDRRREAAEMFDEATRRNPDDYQASSIVMSLWRKLDEPARERAAALHTLDVVERHLRSHPEDVRALYMGGIADIFHGDRARGLARLDHACELQPNDFGTLYNVACGFAVAGERDRALDCLERAFGNGTGFRRWIETDPDMDSLRDHPRFQALIARLQPN